jgi:hypothetical protein
MPNRVNGLSGKSLPPNIAGAMKLWRMGFESLLTTGYIEYHEKAARASLDELINDHRLRLHTVEMKDDGWMDGMRTLQAVVETTKGKLLRIKWIDSHGNGQWHHCCDGGGTCTLWAKDLQ